MTNSKSLFYICNTDWSEEGLDCRYGGSCIYDATFHYRLRNMSAQPSNRSETVTGQTNDMSSCRDHQTTDRKEGGFSYSFRTILKEPPCTLSSNVRPCHHGVFLL